MGKLQKVLIMAGGTGGHVFPGLAVAKMLQDRGVEVHWLGTQKGLESRLVPEANIPLHFIRIAGLRGKGLKEALLTPFRLSYAIYQSMKVINQIKPDVVLGMGGFVSGPGGISTWLLGRPLVVHEQNAKAGLTNKWLSKIAKKVLEGFPGTFSPATNKIITTGNPVRMEIANIASPAQRFEGREKPLRVLVVGGSLGAIAINELVPQALQLMEESMRPQVRHQAGEKNFEATLKNYQAANVRAEVTPFISDMGKAYQWADIVLCRAGALTVTELCAAGAAAILVPYPHAVDDHQTANADYLVKNKAAILVQQSDLTAAGLAKLFSDFSTSPQQCIDMANAAYQLRKVDATNRVLEICGEVCQ